MNNNDLKINWYPGHMAKATKEIKEVANLADLFIIVLDSRCPLSSYNDDFDKIAPNKPRLFIATKSDLMDVSKKEKIAKHFNYSRLLWLDLRNQKSRSIILKELEKINKEKTKNAVNKGFLQPRIKVFVLGVPNAGKSTLINLMTQKKNLKVGNFPGVTRTKSWVNVDNFFFLDTPGILLPNIENQEAAVKLSMTRCIETKQFPIKLIAENYLDVIAKYYPNKLTDDFKIEPKLLANLNDVNKHAIFTQIAKNRGLKVENKLVLDGAHQYFINYVQNLKGVTYE
ncbi:ribosome biogenesis GTPase YlqF [Mycoplasmopsis opalescens]|uniref:ribosome biogenesis GTPase YlqF n=1 Tax=Mycoplasmopsis opalescens TaxID=114886 RepID=UPI0004A707BF|nr:ribosome biogenesis GTPase YlqF [Mycoplasmopsis opalescens]